MSKRSSIRSGLTLISLASAMALLPQAWAQKPAGGAKPTKPGASAAPASSASTAAVDADAGVQVPPLADALTGDAKADYESGRLLFSDGDFAGAGIKFQSAYDKSKDARLLWNIAACQKNQRHYAKVLKLVRQYVAEGADKLSDQDRADAQELIKTIEPFTSSLRFKINEPGAQVYVDDELVGTSPLDQPVLVDLGGRHVKVTKDGFKASDQTIAVGGSTEMAVDVKLVAIVHEGHIIVNAQPESTVAVDGRVVGTGRYEGTVKSGGHTLRVTAQGMRPYQSEVVVQDDETRRIDVNLEPEAKAGGGVPAWMWIAGGAVLVGGASVGGYFLFKPKDETAPPVAGTISPGTVRASF